MSWSRGSRGRIVIGSQCNVNAIQPSRLHSQVDITQNPTPSQPNGHKKDREHPCGALVKLLHLSLICKMSRDWKCFSKENPPLQVDFAPGHSLQIYLNIAQERQIRSVIQIEKSADVAKCKRAVYWLMIRSAWSDCGDRMLMPSVNAAYLSIDLSIYRSIVLSIYHSIVLSIYRSVYLPFYRSVYHSIVF